MSDLCDPSTVKVRIDRAKCQGHGRCYDLAPDVFAEDDEGYGHVVGDGVVASDHEAATRLAEANCPEQAVAIEES
jgi:ferredoxin